MTMPRVLVVEPDSAFALSLAAVVRDQGWISAVAGSAAEAELEIASRRPSLVVMRAELPDLSGFSVCARLRHDRATARLPVILYSSETAPASLAEHARTPWAASAYLAMPLDTAALTVLARRLLTASEPTELADDDPDLLEMAPPTGADGPGPEAGESPEGGGPLPPRTEARAPGVESPAPPTPPSPPPVPRRARRELLTEADRLFADRVFQSVADRRDALVAEAERRRPPPRRDLLATPEGRVTLLREDLKWREAQLARLAEIWEIREREVASVDERIHAKDVDVQRARLEAEEAGRKLAEARRLLGERDREHGASIEGLLSEKFKEEKELIEVVAGSERRLHEQERELRGREERLALAAATAAGLEAKLETLAEEARGLRQQVAEREGQIEGLERAARESDERSAELAEQIEARDALLRGARREVERLQGDLSAARQALMLRESELRGELTRARSDLEELGGLLAQTTRERDEALARSLALEGDLAAARAEAAALGAELEATRKRVEALSAEPTVLERIGSSPVPE
jgi:ParB family transcriptional regulator, chromosome partitioning protein